MLTNCLRACAHLTITVSEIQRDICKLEYGFLFAFYSNYGRIFSHFGDMESQRML